MGCCFSTSVGPSSPYSAGAPNASARHINPPSVAIHDTADPPSTRSSARRRREAGPLDQHINRPLRRCEWTAKDRRWTRQQIDQQRVEFFETRVTGRSEIWQTIHAALRVLWASALSDDLHDEYMDCLATAQSILSAAEISLTTGDLANGVYDSLGNYYQLPRWVVADPSNLACGDALGTQGDLSPSGRQSDTYDPGYFDTHDDDGDNRRDGDGNDADSEARTRKHRQEKGKATLDLREVVTLRARLSETGRDIDVAVAKSDLVRSVARTIANDSTLPYNTKIRLVYMGKMLNDNLPLELQGWQPSIKQKHSVVHKTGNCSWHALPILVP